MAVFQISFDWMMQNEDGPGPPYRYEEVSDPGGDAISGINSAAFPDDFLRILNTPQAERGPLVVSFYQAKFWNRWYAQLLFDEVAKRVFDEGVNAGPVTTVKVLQQAINATGAASVIVDRTWGPATVAAANECAEDELVYCFKQARLARYQAIAAVNPADAHYLGTAAKPGPWWVRAMK